LDFGFWILDFGRGIANDLIPTLMTHFPSNPESTIHNPQSARLLTFRSGGWVILLVVISSLVLLAWALGPVILRMSNRPPGDGEHIESYAFDLSNLAVQRDLIAPATLHRDMVPAMSDPAHSGPTQGVANDLRWDAMQRRNDPQYGKYLVSSDVVIGVTLAGEARCYPLHVLYVHEIVNDTLGGTPIAVTYNWLCGSAMVFDRRITDRVAQFGVSGLVYNSNLLMYDRNEPSQASATTAGAETPNGAASVGGESLFSQLLAKPISGRAAAAGETLTIIPCELVTWADWRARQPETSVLDRNLALAQRYKGSAPTQYFRSPDIEFPVQPLAKAPPEGPLDLKTPVLAVIASDGRRVYSIPYVLYKAKQGDQPSSGGDQPDTSASATRAQPQWTDTWTAAGGASRTLRFIGEENAKLGVQTVRVECVPPDPSLHAINCFWFAWHAMHPEDELALERVAAD
jgi:hypothetical protein